MSIVSLIVVLIFVGVGLYLISLIPMDAKILTIIRVVVILAVLLWLYDAFVGTGTLGTLHGHSLR